MALGLCGIVCKYMLRGINLIFGMLGFASLGLGLWFRFSENTRLMFQISALNSSTFVIGVTAMIVFGAVMLIMVMFGAYAECRERKCALQAFAPLLLIMALAAVVVGVLAYAQRDEVGARAVKFYNSLYNLFIIRRDVGLGVTLAFIHEMLNCCGVTGSPVVEVVKVTCPSGNIDTPRCSWAIADFFDNNATTVMALFLGTAALLITALVCAIILLKQIKKDGTSYTARYSAVY